MDGHICPGYGPWVTWGDVSQDQELRKKANRALLVYGLARLGLFIVLTTVIQAVAVAASAPVPLVVSALLALLVRSRCPCWCLKSSAWRPMRPVAAWSARRKERKAWIADELSSR